MVTLTKSGIPSKRKPPPKPGNRKGIPNKATANAREAIARFVDGNADRLNDWLDQIEMADGPKAAFQCFSDLLEYHVPKLSRAEVQVEGSLTISGRLKRAEERLKNGG
jgi:hypothetical protein